MEARVRYIVQWTMIGGVSSHVSYTDKHDAENKIHALQYLDKTGKITLKKEITVQETISEWKRKSVIEL